MADIDLGLVSSAIVAALRASPSFGGPEAVKRGMYAHPPANVVPFIYVASPGVTSEQGPVMGQYTRTVVYEMRAWAQVTSRDPDEQVVQAEGLLDEVLSALEQERLSPASELYRLTEFALRGTVLLAGLATMPANTVGLFATLEVSFRRRTGLAGASP